MFKFYYNIKISIIIYYIYYINFSVVYVIIINPKIIKKRINGNKTKRISREAGSYYTPVWSPRGDMIAFTKQEGGQFYIGVMEIDGSNERMIAKSFHVEGPTWAPNGRFLMYFKEERTAEDGSGGESSLYSIDLTGYNERKVITPLGGSDPAWSPLMH